MTLSQTLYEIVILTLSKILSNLAWLIILYWGFKTISREIKEGVKQVPKWIAQYEEIKLKKTAVQTARDGMDRVKNIIKDNS